MLVYVGYRNECPGVVVPVPNGCQPCCFGGKTYSGMKIPDGLFDAGELLDVEDGVLLMRTGCINVVADNFCGWYDIFRLQRFSATR